MPPRTLATLAHSLSIAPSPEGALVALAEAVAEVDRYARLALITIDERRRLLQNRVVATGAEAASVTIETTLDHLPARELAAIRSGGRFVDFGDASEEYARLLQLPPLGESGLLAVRGIQYDGALCSLLAVYETRKLFGRTSDRLAPAAALFELALLRHLERDARLEAVQTLEDVTQRVHSEYERRLGDLENRLREAPPGGGSAEERHRLLELERELASATESARRNLARAEAVEGTVGSAVSELERAHVELHRRSEQLRQKTRTLYLIDRVLTLDAGTDDPRALADGLLALIGDDMHANRASLMLSTSNGTELFIAAHRGLGPGVPAGLRLTVGEGVAGRVAESRRPLLVQDAGDANQHPLLADQYFTTGSFVCLPLVYHGELVGVVNLANRARAGVFLEEDVDRARLLGLVISLVATRARLPERLVQSLSVG